MLFDEIFISTKLTTVERATFYTSETCLDFFLYIYDLILNIVLPLFWLTYFIA